MGFFSDLKEDLSQAVNELMPDELTAEDAAQETAAEDVVAEGAEDVAQMSVEDRAVELSLEEMLKNIDEIQVPEDMEMADESLEAAEDNAEVSENAGMMSDVDLEAMLSAALDAIPDENGQIAGVSEPDQSRLYQESAEEVVPEAVEMSEAVPAAEPVMEEKEENKGAEREMDSYANRQALDETAVITAGMHIRGDITSEGSVEVVGTVDGNIDVWGKLNITGHINGNSHASEIYAEGAKINGEIVSAGAVKIGNSSVIIGNITAKSAAIAGAVKGDIDVQGPVILDASAIVMGNIKSKSVQINNGAVIEGMCSQCYADVSPLSFFDEYKTESKNSKKNK